MLLQTITPEMEELRSQIVTVVTRRDLLKEQMESWYETNPGKPCPHLRELDNVDAALSKLDSAYKVLWDQYNPDQKV